VTSHKDIQSLIADIDGILPQTGSRPLWSKPADVAAQRRVLERVRRYLVSLQHNSVAAPEPPTPTSPEQQKVVQQIVQAVTQEMDVIRANLMQPLQADLESLRQQRESLVKEIQQLERTRQQIDSSTQQKTTQQQIMSKFSQELISRYSETLTQHLAQILGDFEAQLLSNESTTGAIAPASSSHGKIPSVMLPRERLEQLRQLQVQADHMLLTLDADQRAIFEALQRNLQGYQQSLSQGLEKMHSLGVQGEMLFTTLVNRLAQQLGREASTLLQSSLQLSDSATQTNQTATNQTTPETLLPTDALSVTTQSSEGSAPNEPQPLAIAKSQSTTEENFAENLQSEDWEIVEGVDADNLDIEPDDQDRLETFIQLDIDESQESRPLGEDEATLSRVNSQDIDYLFGVNENLTTTPSAEPQTDAGEVAGLGELNAAAELNFISDSRRREIDALYESLFGTDSLTSMSKLDEAQVLPLDFPETFPADVQSDSSAPPAAPTNSSMPGDKPLSNAYLVNPLPSQVEDVLFEGLADPAVESNQVQSLDSQARQLADSWEALFFEDSAAPSPIEGNFMGEAPASSLFSNSLSNRESTGEQEGIEIIAALTDLFEKMGLSPLAAPAKAESTLTATKQGSQYPTADTDPQANLVEENYIPASPEEDLLPTDELESDPDLAILLDQNTLQQLQQDLYRFEGSESQPVPRQEKQRLLGDYFELPPIEPDATQLNQQNQRFLMSEELLAEDWEEFSLYDDLSEESASQSLAESTTTELSVQVPEQFNTDEEEVAIASIEEETLGNSTPKQPESVESDFDPDLFPSEALELDQENAASLSATTPEEVAMPEEVVVLDDENFVEMLWDEPTDSTTEEMTSSPESEFDSDFFSPESLDSQQEERADVQNSELVRESALEELARFEELMASQEEPLDEKLGDVLSDSTQGATLPSQALEDNSNSFSQETLDSQQEDTVIQPSSPENSGAAPQELAQTWDLPKLGESVTSEHQALSEDEPADNFKQEAQASDESNFDIDLPKLETLNSEQPDNPKKKNSNSDSEANL